VNAVRWREKKLADIQRPVRNYDLLLKKKRTVPAAVIKNTLCCQRGRFKYSYDM